MDGFGVCAGARELRKQESSMNVEAVLNEFREAGALLEGHFILSSGLHSDRFLQKALVFQDAQRTARLCKALAAKVREQVKDDITAIVSPAVGGIVPGYEMGRQLGLPAMYVERVNGEFQLRRNFTLKKGQKVLMVEDIVSTGVSSRECIAAIGKMGADVVAACCLIDRSAGRASVGVPLIALAEWEVPAWPADDLPPHLKDIPAVKPGSRGLA
jgi:orotate phosphoribosyltransferase